MKKILAIFAFVSLLSSCVSMLLDTRSLGNFTMIDNATPYDIHYYQGSTYSVKVHAHELDLPYIITRVVNGQLFVEYDKTHVFHGTPYVDVYCPTMTQYNGRGSGNFRAMTDMNMGGKDMQFNMSGAGKARMGNVTANHMDMNNNGSGNIHIKNGNTQKTTINNNGSGNVKGRMDGQSFDGQTTNTGNIHMKGNATTVTTKQEGSGTSVYKRTSTPTSSQRSTGKTTTSNNKQASRTTTTTSRSSSTSSSSTTNTKSQTQTSTKNGGRR